MKPTKTEPATVNTPLSKKTLRELGFTFDPRYRQWDHDFFGFYFPATPTIQSILDQFNNEKSRAIDDAINDLRADLRRQLGIR